METSAGAGTAPELLLPDASLLLTPVATSWETDAHGAFIETLTSLLNRLQASDDRKMSEIKRVSVRGELYLADVPGVKFSADFREGKLAKVRVMTAREDADKSLVPAEYGGTGLMAPLTQEEIPVDMDPSTPKRKRAKTTEEPTLEHLLAQASELARVQNRPVVVEQLEILLKMV